MVITIIKATLMAYNEFLNSLNLYKNSHPINLFNIKQVSSKYAFAISILVNEI